MTKYINNLMLFLSIISCNCIYSMEIQSTQQPKVQLTAENLHTVGQDLLQRYSVPADLDLIFQSFDQQVGGPELGYGMTTESLALAAQLPIDEQARFTWLMTAAHFGSTNAIKHLLRAGVVVDERDIHGATALFVALYPIWKLDSITGPYGAKASSYDEAPNNVFEQMVTGQTEIAKLLLEHGADPMNEDENGMTPLIACEF